MELVSNYCITRNEKETKHMASQLLKKISPATVCPNLLKRLDVDGAPKEVILYDVFGITNSFKTGTSDKGSWLQFKGQFEAITTDGEVFGAGGLFIAQPFEETDRFRSCLSGSSETCKPTLG
jgi:hypothetical protein